MAIFSNHMVKKKLCKQRLIKKKKILLLTSLTSCTNQLLNTCICTVIHGSKYVVHCSKNLDKPEILLETNVSGLMRHHCSLIRQRRLTWILTGQVAEEPEVYIWKSLILSLLRPKQNIYVVPITCFWELGSVGRKIILFFFQNIFLNMFLFQMLCMFFFFFIIKFCIILSCINGWYLGINLLLLGLLFFFISLRF